jgi:hypothetical protein
VQKYRPGAYGESHDHVSREKENVKLVIPPHHFRAPCTEKYNKYVAANHTNFDIPQKNT